jgi:hypothetical protein
MNKSIEDLHLLALNDAIYSGRNSRPALEILFNNILFNTTTHDNEKRRTQTQSYVFEWGFELIQNSRHSDQRHLTTQTHHTDAMSSIVFTGVHRKPSAIQAISTPLTVEMLDRYRLCIYNASAPT